MSDLHNDIRALSELVNELDNDLQYIDTGDLPSDLIGFALLEEARRNLAIVARDMEKKIAAVMPKQVMVEGVTFDRRKHKSRTQWDKEALLSAVLDSRLFNPNTGELVEETPLDRVLAVWNLKRRARPHSKNAVSTRMSSAHVEDRGWQIQVTS